MMLRAKDAMNVISVSGGKDSLAIWLLAKEADVNHEVVFADTGHEHPTTIEYLIDGGLIITGSYNFTKAAATRHAENVLFIRDPELFAAYLKNFNEHFSHSKPYEVRHGSHP